MSPLPLLPHEVSTRGVARWAWATLAANTVIILTGGLVRLTGSGLGCPTWPRCTPTSYVPHRELGVHAVIEFGNRLLTYVLVAVAVGTLLALWRWSGTSGTARRLGVLIALGIPLQAVIGGVTVLTSLNPWVVALHLLLSMVIVALAVRLVLHVRGRAWPAAGAGVRALAVAMYAAMWVAVYLGTVVTGSGPHAGDADSPRTGLDPHTTSQVHAASVYLLVGLTVGLLWAARGTALSRPVLALLALEAAQGAIGYVQYLTGLPVVLVALHLLGAASLVALATWVLLRSRAGAPAQGSATYSSGSTATARKSTVT